MRARACELVVFDWDGTLMDSAARIVAAVQAATAAGGLEPRTDAQIREVIGLGMEEAVARLYPGMPAHAARRLAAGYREAFVQAVAERPAALFPGVTETLAELEAGGYLLAVATGKSRAGLRRDLAQAGMERRFVAARTADECGSKPSPRMLHELLAELGVEPGAALMVGDTLFDLEMAQHAGVPAVAVSWGVHGRERLAAADPRAVIDAWPELTAWLARERALAGGGPGTAP